MQISSAMPSIQSDQLNPSPSVHKGFTDMFDRMVKRCQTDRNNAKKIGISAILVTAASVTALALTLANPFLIGGILLAGLAVTLLAYKMHNISEIRRSVFSFMRDAYTPDKELMNTRFKKFAADSDESIRTELKHIANEIQNVLETTK